MCYTTKDWKTLENIAKHWTKTIYTWCRIGFVGDHKCIEHSLAVLPWDWIHLFTIFFASHHYHHLDHLHHHDHSCHQEHQHQDPGYLSFFTTLEIFLPDPGVSGVRSMGPGVSNYDTFVKLCWCYSGWWWYQLNTFDDANLKRSLAIRNHCHICKSH